MSKVQDRQEGVLKNINTLSSPSRLRITDIRFAMITKVPMDCIIIKIMTNSELVGYGEIRDWGSMTYGLMLKSRLIGQNPCDVDRIFRSIKQFGGHARQGGGVSGIEIALWDLAGKAYGVPIYQMLGGAFRDKVRMYSDTDCDGRPDGKKMGAALKKRRELGFTFLKMDLGIDQILDIPGTLSAPIGFIDQVKKSREQPMFPSHGYTPEYRAAINTDNIAHPFTGMHITEKGFDVLEEYLAEARAIAGYDIPLAIDHLGHIDVTDCIKLGRRLEKYNIAWMEDPIPWQYTDQYVRMANSMQVPLCTGEDIYLKENFYPLLDSGALGVVHPDVLTSGGIMETKKLGDIAQEKGIAMAIHMAETPIACMAAAHVAMATENFFALEFHSVDVPWWSSLVQLSGNGGTIVKDGFITVPDAPGLGIVEVNDEVIREHKHPAVEDIWMSTDDWNSEWSHDRLWS